MSSTFKVDGGSRLSAKLSWLQKLLYHDGQFCLNVPFSFPTYVTPGGKKLSKRERIQLNVNSSTGSGIVCKYASHPLKVRKLVVDLTCFQIYIN